MRPIIRERYRIHEMLRFSFQYRQIPNTFNTTSITPKQKEFGGTNFSACNNTYSNTSYVNNKFTNYYEIKGDQKSVTNEVDKHEDCNKVNYINSEYQNISSNNITMQESLEPTSNLLPISLKL